jgi:ubiquinone biosynthesis monooxygenase Coq7
MPGAENASPIDRLIAELDRSLRTLAGVHRAARPSPGDSEPQVDLEDAERDEAAALMRVNHAGEVCAQALYQGQALTARGGAARAAFEQAAREEEDHLAWSAARIRELNGRPSLLNPLWYGGSLAMGAVAGLLGDRWSLAFLAETERQVEEHLTGHLDRLPTADARTRKIVEAMRSDEAKHRATAVALNPVTMPAPVQAAMRAAARVMTTLAHRV